MAAAIDRHCELYKWPHLRNKVGIMQLICVFVFAYVKTGCLMTWLMQFILSCFSFKERGARYTLMMLTEVKSSPCLGLVKSILLKRQLQLNN